MMTDEEKETVMDRAVEHLKRKGFKDVIIICNARTIAPNGIDAFYCVRCESSILRLKLAVWLLDKFMKEIPIKNFLPYKLWRRFYAAFFRPDFIKKISGDDITAGVGPEVKE